MGFLVSDFNIVIYIEQNKSSTIYFLGTNLEHCTFYHFYFAQAQYPRQKKERRMKNSRFLENSQNHFNFLYIEK